MATVHVMHNGGMACVGDELAKSVTHIPGVSLCPLGYHNLPDTALMVYRAEPGWFAIRRKGMAGRLKRFQSFDRALAAAKRIAATD
ncbi:hypothetical protein YH64_009070 [Achromobacter sp. LC458]|uniref:hypothetical protein n=1 Tax=Achromobacter sp. LC458 TaxID=1120623 RepID=UPI00062A053D|nr:hypothetical protein [Achromobacter sp. LC458]TRM53241.1 hypothetical protein YH64_009070 [Achromobacter sp. LC458]